MRSQNSLAPVGFSLALLLSQLSLMPAALAIPNPIDNGREQIADLPPVPTTPPPPPDGNRTPGGGLGDQAVCPQKPQDLTAITPMNVHGKTLSEHPTFWFYMPYTAAEVPGGEFTVLTRDEENEIYTTSFTLPDQSGLVSISLPASAEYSLEEGQYYHWYLNLDCAASTDSQNDLNIDGWVQRVTATPERKAQVDNTSPEIWYDAIDHLADQLRSNSTNRSTMEQTWTALLKLVELCDFTEEPLVGSVTPLES